MGAGGGIVQALLSGPRGSSGDAARAAAAITHSEAAHLLCIDMPHLTHTFCSAHRLTYVMLRRYGWQPPAEERPAAPPWPSPKELSARTKFNELDVDKDGYISADEIVPLCLWVWKGFHPGASPLAEAELTALRDKLMKRRDMNKVPPPPSALPNYDRVDGVPHRVPALAISSAKP